MTWHSAVVANNKKKHLHLTWLHYFLYFSLSQFIHLHIWLCISYFSADMFYSSSSASSVEGKLTGACDWERESRKNSNFTNALGDNLDVGGSGYLFPLFPRYYYYYNGDDDDIWYLFLFLVLLTFFMLAPTIHLSKSINIFSMLPHSSNRNISWYYAHHSKK